MILNVVSSLYYHLNPITIPRGRYYVHVTAGKLRPREVKKLVCVYITIISKEEKIKSLSKRRETPITAPLPTIQIENSPRTNMESRLSTYSHEL